MMVKIFFIVFKSFCKSTEKDEHDKDKREKSGKEGKCLHRFWSSHRQTSALHILFLGLLSDRFREEGCFFSSFLSVFL